jgi:hypothetical protein
VTVPNNQTNPPLPDQAQQPTYTFSQTSYGTVQIFQNGQMISTTTPQYETQQYGYQPLAGSSRGSLAAAGADADGDGEGSETRLGNPIAQTQTMTAIEYKGYRIEICPVGKGWRASIYSPGSKSPLPESPTNLEKSRSEEIVAEARVIDARLGLRVL